MNRLSEFMTMKQNLIKNSQDKKLETKIRAEREIRDKLRSMAHIINNRHREIIKNLYKYNGITFKKDEDERGEFVKKGRDFIRSIVGMINDLYVNRKDASLVDIARICSIISEQIISNAFDSSVPKSLHLETVQFPSVSAFIDVALEGGGYQRNQAGKRKAHGQARDYFEEIYNSINGTHGIMHYIRILQEIDPELKKTLEEQDINVEQKDLFDAQSSHLTRNEIREFIKYRGDELGVDNITLDDWLKLIEDDQEFLRKITSVIYALKQGKMPRLGGEVRNAIEELKEYQQTKQTNKPDFEGVDQPPSDPLRLIDTPDHDKEQAQEEQATNQAIIIEDAFTPPKEKPSLKDMETADKLLKHLLNKNVIDLNQYSSIKVAIDEDKNVLVRFKAMLRNGGADVTSMRTRCADFVKEQKEITQRENIRQNKLLLKKKPTNIEGTRFGEFAESLDEDVDVDVRSEGVDAGPKVRINTKNIRVEDPEQEALAEQNALAEQEALEKAKKQANIANKLVSLAVRLENKYNTIFKLADKIERKYSKLRG